MRASHLTAPLIRSTAGCLLLLAILVPDAKAQRRRGGSDLPRIGLYGGAIYTGAFGGTGGGFQFSASVPIPVSALGAQYTAGIQFSYSQPSMSGITFVGAQRQLYGYGGYAMATWSLGGHVFPYVRIPVQGITSVVPTPAVGVTGTPPQAENTPGTASSLAIGIGGGSDSPRRRGLQRLWRRNDFGSPSLQLRFSTNLVTRIRNYSVARHTGHRPSIAGIVVGHVCRTSRFPRRGPCHCGLCPLKLHH